MVLLVLRIAVSHDYLRASDGQRSRSILETKKGDAMTDLKPCPFCGGGAHAERSEHGGFNVTCTHCGCRVHDSNEFDQWNTRPVPELPDGYTCNRHVLFFEGAAIATIGIESGRLYFGGMVTDHIGLRSLEPEHLPALAIWLQRITNNTTGEKQ